MGNELTRLPRVLGPSAAAIAHEAIPAVAAAVQQSHVARYREVFGGDREQAVTRIQHQLVQRLQPHAWPAQSTYGAAPQSASSLLDQLSRANRQRLTEESAALEQRVAPHELRLLQTMLDATMAHASLQLQTTVTPRRQRNASIFAAQVGPYQNGSADARYVWFGASATLPTSPVPAGPRPTTTLRLDHPEVAAHLDGALLTIGLEGVASPNNVFQLHGAQDAADIVRETVRLAVLRDLARNGADTDAGAELRRQLRQGPLSPLATESMLARAGSFSLGIPDALIVTPALLNR